jgi:hypothetical protein
MLGRPQTLEPPDSISQVLGLQRYTMMASRANSFEKIPVFGTECSGSLLSSQHLRSGGRRREFQANLKYIESLPQTHIYTNKKKKKKKPAKSIRLGWAQQCNTRAKSASQW